MSTSQLNEAKRISPLKGLGVLLCLVVVIAGFIALCGVFSIQNFWVGFLFLFYWAGVEQANLKRLLPIAAGAIVGLLICWGFVLLPQHLGTPTGSLAILVLVLVSIYLLILGRLAAVINQSTMLFLTVGTIPVIQSNVPAAEIFNSLALGVVYFGALAGLANWLVRPKSVPQT